MDKQHLCKLILEYTQYKEKIRDAYWYKEECLKQNKPNAEQAIEQWIDLIAEDDDRWQNLINYIYQDH
jgi:hypothetical protein